MRIALYDRLPADDLDLYRSTGHDVVIANRFRPARAGQVDLILTTYTRPPDIGVPVVNVGSHHRHLTGTTAPVWDMPGWSSAAVARYVIRAIDTHLLTGTPRPLVAVVGAGRIGRLVHRWLLRCGYDPFLVHHDQVDPQSSYWPMVDVVTLHVADGRGLMDRVLPALDGAVLINTAVRYAVSDAALERALDFGHVEHAVIDAVTKWRHPLATVTPRIAGVSDRSARLRRRRVLDAIRAAGEGRLDEVATRWTRGHV